MTNFRIATAFLLLLSNLAALPATGTETCAAIQELGTPSLDRFNYTVSIGSIPFNLSIDADCEYTLKISFKHDETLPMASKPMTQCNPTITPPILAPDDLPYFAFRWFYEKVPEDVAKVTGIDHISIDWNPCGHPPVEKFGAPHYDLHIYRETPEFRTCMTCTKVPDTPICDPAPDSQTTNSGLVIGVQCSATDQPSNMPADFVVGMSDMIPLMGGHAWNPSHEPDSVETWDTPVWLMGPYDGGIVDFEPMIPLKFIIGDTDHEYSESLVYEGQTVDELPSSYSVNYDATTSKTTLVLVGSSADKKCKAPKAAKKKKCKKSKNKKDKSSKNKKD
eukprot:scaffold1698_cov279-Chaetoceros_neogracile.AAC.32